MSRDRVRPVLFLKLLKLRTTQKSESPNKKRTNDLKKAEGGNNVRLRWQSVFTYKFSFLRKKI